MTSDGVEAALGDFKGVWEHAIRDVMGHDLSQLENNLCVLVIPANVCKTDVKFYMTLLLQRMRFRGVCVLQDSVSACYASVCTRRFNPTPSLPCNFIRARINITSTFSGPQPSVSIPPPSSLSLSRFRSPSRSSYRTPSPKPSHSPIPYPSPAP